MSSKKFLGVSDIINEDALIQTIIQSDEFVDAVAESIGNNIKELVEDAVNNVNFETEIRDVYGNVATEEMLEKIGAELEGVDSLVTEHENMIKLLRDSVLELETKVINLTHNYKKLENRLTALEKKPFFRRWL